MKIKSGKKERYLVLVALVYAVFLIGNLATSVQAVDKVYKIKLPSVEPWGAANTMGCEVFKDYVEAASGGRIQIDLHPGGELAFQEEAFELVKSGTGEIKMAQADEYLTGFYDPLNVITIPYLFDDERIARQFFFTDFFEQLKQEFIEHTGVRILSYQPYGLRCFFNKKRPIKKMEDLKGIKFRVMPVPLMVKFVEALGASPTPIDWSELYTALKTGVVDGAELPLTLMYNMKFYEVSKYYTIDRHTLGFNGFMINEKFYQSLPTDLQRVLVQGARLGGDVEYGVTTYGDRIENVKKLEKQGMEVYVLTPAERERWKKASQPPAVEWLSGKIGQAYIDKTFKAVEEIKANILK